MSNLNFGLRPEQQRLARPPETIRKELVSLVVDRDTMRDPQLSFGHSAEEKKNIEDKVDALHKELASALEERGRPGDYRGFDFKVSDVYLLLTLIKKGIRKKLENMDNLKASYNDEIYKTGIQRAKSIVDKFNKILELKGRIEEEDARSLLIEYGLVGEDRLDLDSMERSVAA